MSGGRTWTLDEDATVRCLRTHGMDWQDIARQLPGRTAAGCRKRLLRTLQEPDPRDIGARSMPDSLHRNGEPLRPGHPVAWQAITAGTVIDGHSYQQCLS